MSASGRNRRYVCSTGGIDVLLQRHGKLFIEEGFTSNTELTKAGVWGQPLRNFRYFIESNSANYCNYAKS